MTKTGQKGTTPAAPAVSPPSLLDSIPPAPALHLLAAVLLLVATPLLFRVHPWVAGYCGGVALWWGVQVWRGETPPDPPRWLMILAALLAMGVVGVSHGRLLGREAGMALLLIAAFLKMMEIHARRDGVLVVVLGFFLLLTEFFHGQEGWRVMHALAGVVLLTTALAGLNLIPRQEERFPWRRLLATGSLLTVQAVPLMLFFFFLFPRLAQPLWGLPQDAFEGRSKTGMSDTMSPGSIGDLILSDEVAFRVRFDGALPPPNQRYWRGPVLWLFNGRQWRTWTEDPGVAQEVHSPELPIFHEVVLEPHGQRWLFALDLPVAAPPASRLGSDFQLLAEGAVEGLRRYRAESALRYRAGVSLDAGLRQRGLQLPARGNPRARALAEAWRQEGGTPETMVAKALELFRQGGFSYTLSPPVIQGEEVDDFLFVTRQGFCEHFSGAFVFLMRGVGVPARVVLGYMGGEFNPLSGELTVRQSHAHAWSEVWLPEQGWVRVDPTAAVSPERVERESALQLSGMRGEFSLWALDHPLARWGRQAWDAMGSRWNRWVLGYDALRQQEMLLRFGFDGGGWRELTVGLTVTAALFSLLLVGGLLWQGRGSRAEATEEAYRRFCLHLARRGVKRKGQEGPVDFAARASAVAPERAGEIQRIVRLYVALRYGERESLGDVALLQRLVRSFRRHG